MDQEIQKKLNEILEASRILHEKTDAEIAEHKKKTDAEIEAIRKESELLKKQTDAEIAVMRKDTEKNLNRVSSELGSHTDNVAGISEEYFYRSLRGSMKLGDMKFHEISPNTVIDGKEYDIILRNGKVAMLVSVKTTLQPKHVNQLVKKDLPVLARHFKKGIAVYGAVAGLRPKGKVLERAQENGILMLSMSEDNNVTTVNPDVSLTAF